VILLFAILSCGGQIGYLIPDGSPSYSMRVLSGEHAQTFDKCARKKSIYDAREGYSVHYNTAYISSGFWLPKVPKVPKYVS